MKVVTVFAIAALLVSAVFSMLLMSHNALYVVGGEYDLAGGQTVEGNLYALFADVRVGAGAQVEGRIFSLCSDVELAGEPEEEPVVWDLFGFSIRIPPVSYVQIGR